jgi:hypothetical protein
METSEWCNQATVWQGNKADRPQKFMSRSQALYADVSKRGSACPAFLMLDYITETRPTDAHLKGFGEDLLPLLETKDGYAPSFLSWIVLRIDRRKLAMRTGLWKCAKCGLRAITDTSCPWPRGLGVSPRVPSRLVQNPSHMVKEPIRMVKEPILMLKEPSSLGIVLLVWSVPLLSCGAFERAEERRHSLVSLCQWGCC